jgi:hypothetical protein
MDGGNEHRAPHPQAFGVDDGRILPLVATIGLAFTFLFSTWSNSQDNEVCRGSLRPMPIARCRVLITLAYVALVCCCRPQDFFDGYQRK